MKNVKIRKVLSIVLSGAIFLSSCIATGLVIAADTPAAPINTTIDFKDYNLVAHNGTTGAPGNTRDNAGTYKIVDDVTATGGKYLEFTRNNTGHNDAFYMFILNQEGKYTSADKDKVIMLDPAKKYRVTVRYKITGIANDQAFLFRLSTTTAGSYDISNRSNATADRALVFGDKGPKTEWTIASGVLSVPAPANADNNYSLIASFAPSYSTEDATNAFKDVSGWSTAIDYIKIEEATDDVIIDFDKYTLDANSHRTEAGTFTIRNDSECTDQTYLEFKDDSTSAGTHIAHHMFQANMTGDISSPSVTKLVPGTKYDVKIRYRLSGLASDYKLAFRFYNCGDYALNTWSNDGTNMVEVASELDNTTEWTEKTFEFTAPSKGTSGNDKYSLLAAFAPFKGDSVDKAATFVLDLDYIKITKHAEPPVFEPFDGTDKVDFDQYVVKSTDYSGGTPGNTRSNAGTFAIKDDDATASAGKYLKFTRTNGGGVHSNYYMFAINQLGSYTSAEKDKVITLSPAKKYKITVRYKIEGIGADQKYQFRLYNSNAGTYHVCDPKKGQIIFSGTGPQNTWVEQSAEVQMEAPDGGDMNYGLIGFLAPTKTLGYIDNAADVDDWSASIDYVNIEVLPDPIEPPAQTADGTGKIDFNCYTVNADSVRSNAGTFSIGDNAACEDGKFLKFVDDNSVTDGDNIIKYAFQANHTGGTAADKVTKLIPGQSYDIKIRYKLMGLADDYKLGAYFYNSGDYTLTNWSNDGVNRIELTNDLAKTENWTEKEFTIIAPSKGESGDDVYSLLAAFAPLKDGNPDSNATFELHLDYIDIKKTPQVNPAPNQTADGTGKIDFDSYIVDKDSNRTEAGTFTIEESTDCADGKYLKFVDNSASKGSHIAHHMFQCNHTGDTAEDKVTKLIPGERYDVKIRYKLSGLADDYSLDFRLYNSCSYTLADWSTTDNSNYVEVANKIANTSEWVEKEYTFTAPAHKNDSYSLLAAFAPFKNGVVKQEATYELCIDYIEFVKSTKPIPIPFNEKMELHFDEYTVDSNSVRDNAGTFTIVDDASCSNGKYLNFVDNSTTSSSNYAHYMFQANPTGGTTKEKVTMLDVAAKYKVKVRYKVSDLTADHSLAFRFYNLGSYKLVDWATGGQNYVELDVGITNTDGWVEKEYTFLAPKSADTKYSLAACFAPVRKNMVREAATFNLSVDYIIIEKLADANPEDIPKDYPLPWDELPEVSADEESKLVFRGKDSSFWSNQFDSGKDYAISYGWSKLDRDHPNYKTFQAVNTITMTNQDLFYENPAKANLITAFQGEPVDMTNYIKTGHLRFWVKVDRDTKVKFQMQSKNYKAGEIILELKKTEENNGFAEVVIPLKDFYDSAIERKAKWEHNNMWAIVIYPETATPDGFMKNGETMIFSPWEVWSKEPLDVELDMNIYYYSQVGCDIKIRDNNQVLPSSTTIRSFREKVEEKSVAKLISSNFKGAELLEYWAIYAISNAQTGSYIETPYDDVELLLPKTGAFADKNLQIAVVGTDGSITILPYIDDGSNLVVRTSLLGNFAFFTGNGTYTSIAAGGGADISLSPESGDKGYMIARIWIMAFIMSALCFAVIWFDKIKNRKNLTKMLSLALCLGIALTTLAGCGDDDKKPAKKPTASQTQSGTQDTESTPDTDAEDTSSDLVDEDQDEDEDEDEVEEKILMSMGVVMDHPGVPGYDAEYEFRVSAGPEDDMARLDKSLYTLSCSHKEVIVKGNKIILPASFKDNTDADGILIKATYKEDPSVFAYYPLQITKYTTTFADEFNEDGTPLDRNLWTNQEEVYHEYGDMKNGTTNIRLDEFCYKKDGNLVMPIVKNTTGETWMINSGNTKTAFTPDYISSEVRTDYTFAQEFGCFTVKMKGPASSKTTAGTNNAFWIMPQNGNWGKTFFFDHNSGKLAGQATGEIDIVERSAAWNGEWQNTIHTWDPLTGKKAAASGSAIVLFDQNLVDGGWMEYTCVWTRDSLYTYLNGELVRAEKDLRSYGTKGYMILSNNLNSLNPDNPAWTGYATEADFEDLTVYVDYVRAYSIG